MLLSAASRACNILCGVRDPIIIIIIIIIIINIDITTYLRNGSPRVMNYKSCRTRTRVCARRIIL